MEGKCVKIRSIKCYGNDQKCAHITVKTQTGERKELSCLRGVFRKYPREGVLAKGEWAKGGEDTRQRAQ